MKLQHIDKLNLVSFFVCTNRFKHRNFFALFFFDRRCISNSLSTHRMAYVANLFPYSGRKLSTAFISPIVPMEIRSSCSSSELTYFFATWATRRMLCNTSSSFAPCSPFFNLHRQSVSSSGVRGTKNVFTQHLFQQLSNILCQQKAFCAFPFYIFSSGASSVCAGSGFPLIRNVSFQYLILYKCKCFLLPRTASISKR